MKTLRRLIKDQKTRVALALAAGVCLLVVWLSVVDLGEMTERLAAIDVRYLLLFTILWTSAAFLRSLRWRTILGKIQHVPVGESFALFMSCMFVNFLIPLRAGEAVASLVLKRNHGVAVARSLPTQVLDRLFDLTPIVPALLLALLMAGPGADRPGLHTLMTILAFVATVFVLLGGIVFASVARPAAAAAIIRAVTRPLPGAIRARVQSFAVLCAEGLAALRLGGATIVLLIGMTFLALALDAASLGVIFLGLGVPIAPAILLTGYTFLFLTSALPRPPGLVGSHEVLFLLIFSLLLGVDKNLASAAVVVGHLMLALLLTLTGAISLFSLGIRSASDVRDHLPTVTTPGAS
ncbi:MAG TPA: lysylphosphatidylglycerol synthase transmembrane domain-containing protein [Candidatus Polarisedimenticolia bacterium]|nr:lysylphosphatidylglycerol synthase transmembrane domain-containing protein [Candidatus Polarisedimenticolia bacterium]